MASAGSMGHILIIVENLPLPFDRRVWQEARTLKRSGYDVSVICPKGRGFDQEYEQLEGVDIYRHSLPVEAASPRGYLAEYGAALYHEFRLAAKIYKKKRFNIIQACNPPDLIFLVGLVFKLLFGVKFVFDHHDLCPELWLAKFGKKNWGYKALLIAERLTFMIADASIATNESYRQVATGRGKMDPDKVVVVRSGPDLKRVCPVPPNPEWKMGRKYLVGYLGVMGRQEGIDHLLEAARYLIQDRGRRDVSFVFVGGGTELAAMRSLAEQLNISGYVRFTGRVPDNVLLEALSTADVCVNPDVANEMNDKSTMNKIMEYMALGKPIVQYDLTEGRVSARDGSLYAAPNDTRDLARKIEILLADEQLRGQMGEKGRQRVATELHWGVEAPKYIGFYNDIV